MQALILFRYIAQFYVVVCLVESLFGPVGNYIFFENYLFIPAFGFAAYVSYKDKQARLFTGFFLLIFVWIVVSDSIAYENIITSHLLYALRWIKYPVVFLIISERSNNSLNNRVLKNVITSVFFILCTLNLVLLLNPWQLGESIQFFFSPKADFLLSNYHEPGIYRLSGTMTNPNDNAVVFGLFFLFFYFNKEQRDWKMALMAFAFVLLAQSRTVLILLTVIIAVDYLLRQFRSKKFNYLPIIAILLGGSIFILLSNSAYLKSIFTGEAFASNSFVVRIENFIAATKASTSDLITGQGYAVNQVEKFGRYLDSEIISFIAQYGIIGLILWLVFFGFSIFHISKRYTNRAVWVSFFFLFFGISLTNNSFLNIQTSILFLFLLGLSSSIERGDSFKNNTDEEPQ